MMFVKRKTRNYQTQRTTNKKTKRRLLLSHDFKHLTSSKITKLTLRYTSQTCTLLRVLQRCLFYFLFSLKDQFYYYYYHYYYYYYFLFLPWETLLNLLNFEASNNKLRYYNQIRIVYILMLLLNLTKTEIVLSVMVSISKRGLQTLVFFLVIRSH